jgi:hypothetical protein
MAGHKIYAMSFAKVYPLLLAKVERKGRSKAELDRVIEWLLGYDEAGIAAALAGECTLEDFYGNAPAMNPDRTLITGVVCGVRVEEVPEPLMREIRYLDKLVDELARGKALDKVLRS